MKHLQAAQILALDIEADSMFHFKERVCLIQIAANESVFLIDPLVIEDLRPLKKLLKNRSVPKVLHGADYDVRSLFRDFKIVLPGLFDTQIACRFLGITETGLDAVLNARFNLKLDKRFQKKNWSQRPLPPEMLAYAASDVAFLIPLYGQLEAELQTKERLTWVLEECRRLSKVRPPVEDDCPLFIGFKGAGRLRRRNLAVLEALLQYRRKIAQKKDRPLFKVFSNKGLMTLAAHPPKTLQELDMSATLSKRQISMYGTELIRTIKEAMRIPPAELPVYPRQKPSPPDPRLPRRIKALKAWRDGMAEKLSIDPALIANKNALTAIAGHMPNRIKDLRAVDCMQNWQIKAFGREIIAALDQVR